MNQTESQKKQILQALRNLKRIGITQGYIDAEIGCTRLAARIGDLKRDGHKITTEMIPVSNRSGKTVRVALYRLRK